MPIVRPADLVLRNGKIITVDRTFTIAESIAIAGDRVLAVGPNAAMTALTSLSTRTIDLRGKTVIPGLIDGHAHMDREGLKSVFPSLGPVRSIRDIQDRIAELARGARPGEWIVTMPIGDPPFYFGVPDSLAEKRWPTRQELDVAAPNNPVFIRPIWGFWRGTPPLVACANTEALKRAGITRDTVSPLPELVIEKDANGEPTGVFIEDGMQPTAELIWFRDATEFSRQDRVRGISIAAQAYHTFGTTGVFEGHGVANEVIRAYKDAHRDGTLTMRAGLVFSPNGKAAGNAPLGSFIEAWGGWLAEPSFGDDWLKVTGLYVNIGREPGNDVVRRCPPTPDGPASTTTPAYPARASRRCCLLARRKTFARFSTTARPASSISWTRSIARCRSKAGAGSSSTSTSYRLRMSSGSFAWASSSPRTRTRTSTSGGTFGRRNCRRSGTARTRRSRISSVPASRWGSSPTMCRSPCSGRSGNRSRDFRASPMNASRRSRRLPAPRRSDARPRTAPISPSTRTRRAPSNPASSPTSRS